MARMDAFSQQIVELVRRMPDEAILALVRNQLGGLTGGSLGGLVAGGGASGGTRARRGRGRPAGGNASAAARPAPARAAAKGRAGGRKRGGGRGRGGANAAQRTELLDKLERIVKSGQGMSASEIARESGVAQSQVAARLKELKTAKRIFQGGDRRFARYAADPKTAEQASLNARQSASGPRPAKKAAKKKKR